MTQLDLFEEPRDYVADLCIPGTILPTVRYPDHRDKNMRKPFVMWDGEGYTDDKGQHHYWLLANSCGGKIMAPAGRSIERYNIARFLLDEHARIGPASHIGFALGYDFTCILRGNRLTSAEVGALVENQLMRADGYVWRLRMGKQLEIWLNSIGARNEFRLNGKINLQDVWGFFQRSFVNALDEYFGPGWKYRDTVIEMKQERGNFDREHDEDVIRYNDMELELGVELMEELRERLYNAGLPITRWYGPGALANGLMKNWRIGKTLVRYDKEAPLMSIDSQKAYAGGRFELFKPGHVGGPVYQYDINSAYPYAIAQLPNLAAGSWEYIEKPELTDLTEFSMVKLELDSAVGSYALSNGVPPTCIPDIYPESIPFPLWHRDSHGRIAYPGQGIRGVYHAPEVFAMVDYVKSLPKFYEFDLKLHGAWVFRPENPLYYYTLNKSREWQNGSFWTDFAKWDKISSVDKWDILPFWQVSDLYDRRQKLKRIGNGAHIGIKLALNSLYGKFAQQVGYDKSKDRIPPFHNLVLAGWVTSMCRAMILRAIMQNPEAIIATETDGIFSTAKLNLPIGNGLGMWEATEYEDMYYYASGFRFGIRDGDIYKPATRGIPVRDIHLDVLKDVIRDAHSILHVSQRQFVTLNWGASMNRLSDIGSWREYDKELRLMCEDPRGKRVHDYDCPACIPTEYVDRVYGDGLHYTLPATLWAYQESMPHKISWVDNASDNSNMEIDTLFEI